MVLIRNPALMAMLLGAVGVGTVVGIGISLIIQLVEVKRKLQRRNLMTFKEDEVNEEVSELRRNSLSSRSRTSLRSCCSRCGRLRRNELDTDDEMFSALGSEIEDFFDINSDEEASQWSFGDNKPRVDDENINNLFDEVDILLKGGDEDRLNALSLLRQKEYFYSENSNFLWRMAKAHQMQATAYGGRKNLAKKEEFVLQGLTYAGKALTVDPSNPDAHKWYAILVGMQGEFLSVKEKIQNGFVFQEHLTEALKSKPKDYTLYHLLGRFKYEIANLSWVEKKVASTLFAELPSVTVQDAIADFEKAEDLNPNPWKENRLFLAKCHISAGNYLDGVQWLVSAKEINTVTQEDRVSNEECDQLLYKYKKYKKN